MRKLLILVTAVLVLGGMTVLPASARAISCPGSLPTRLDPTGPGTGRIAHTFSTLRSSPGGPAIEVVYAPATFTVLEGPASDGYLCYFKIDYGGGKIGWAAESQIYSIWGYSKYWLEPTTIPPQPVFCPGSRPTQLVVGNPGHIAEVFSTLRSYPGGPAIQVMYAPATFNVVDGPQSDGYLCYFKIDYGGGKIGWAAESEIYSIWGYNKYWLLPN